MRKNIVAGNWKMNNTFDEAIELIQEITERIEDEGKGETEVVICPPAVYMELTTDIAEEEENFKVGAQNCCAKDFGAVTGEISAPMLASMDVAYCIIGHSERRKYFNEKDEILAQKAKILIDNKVTPIFCCGEVLEEREANTHFEVVEKQVETALFGLDKEEITEVVVAYEPVWAIGTGKTATPAQAQEMHAFIRKLFLEKFGPEVANDMTILYGGSCNAKNAKELFSQTDVDGGLIGGASLKAPDFLEIINAF